MKETAIKRSVYIPTALALGASILPAVSILPRLTSHPQAIHGPVNRSSKVFFAILLVATILFSVFVIRIRGGGSMNIGLLRLAAILIFFRIS